MFHIPFFWFSLLFIFIYKNRGFNVSAYICLLYVITSACSSMIVLSGKYMVEINLITVIIYCLLISLVIIAIYNSDFSKIKSIIVPNQKLIDYITYFFFFITVISIMMYWKDIVYIVMLDDWGALRDSINAGNNLTISHFGGVMHHVQSFINIFGKASYLLFPIFFLNLFVFKKPTWFCLMSLLGTTNVIINGILTIDRSTTFGWFIMLGLSFVMFRKNVDKTKIIKIAPFITIPIVLGIVYFIMVTFGRFGESSGGADNAVINYAGQPFLNFCKLFENFDNHEGITTKQLFPYTHEYIIKDYDGVVAYQNKMSNISHIECAVFYTYLGAFILDSNQFGPFLFSLLYLVLLYFVSGTQQKHQLNINRLLLLFILYIIPSYG